MKLKIAGLIVGSIVTLIIMICIGLGLYGISTKNMAVRMEKGIQAQYTQNQNTRSKMVNSIAEAAQVPEMYKNDFKEVVAGAMEGRYGKDGSKAVFQWINEHQINFDSSLYTKLQAMIEANRAEFALEQEKLIDKKRIYDTELGSTPRGDLMHWLGFPKIDLAKYKIVVSKDNQKVFNEGVAGPMKLR